MPKVVGEITYTDREDYLVELVDVFTEDGNINSDTRKQMHALLDAWIDHAQCDGFIWIGNEKDFRLAYGSAL